MSSPITIEDVSKLIHENICKQGFQRVQTDLELPNSAVDYQREGDVLSVKIVRAFTEDEIVLLGKLNQDTLTSFAFKLTDARDLTGRLRQAFFDPLFNSSAAFVPPLTSSSSVGTIGGGSRAAIGGASVGDLDRGPLGLTNPTGSVEGGGMIVGPDHPMFTSPTHRIVDPLMDPRFNLPPHLPRGAVPPGARFDPIVPFGAPQMRGRGRGDAHFTGEPDNDAFFPPGTGGTGFYGGNMFG